MTNIDRKREQDAARARKYRRNKKEKAEEQIDLADICDTPLIRQLRGLPPHADDLTTRFATRRDESLPLVNYADPNFRGIAGQSERVKSPYGIEARKRAQAEEQRKLTDVIDYSQGAPARGEDQRSRVERIKRSLGLSGEDRKNHQKLQEHIRYAMAAEDGELLERNRTVDWSTVTEDGHLPEQRQEELDPHSVQFEAPWRRRGSDPYEGESITLDLRK
jgi:hypothetical protein